MAVGRKREGGRQGGRGGREGGQEGGTDAEARNIERVY